MSMQCLVHAMTPYKTYEMLSGRVIFVQSFNVHRVSHELSSGMFLHQFAEAC
jgi:hypothetical protein